MGKKDKDADDAVAERETWSNPAEFVLCCLGYAVGLGNIWRFPYICFQNGGGAFLIPYAIMLTFVGIPVFFMELIMGQYSAKGPLHVWAAVPVFKGLGLGMVFISVMICVFYTMVIGYTLYFLVISFFNPLPYDSCQHDFNTAFCYNKKEAIPCERDQNGTWFNNTCFNETYLSVYDELKKYCNSTDCYWVTENYEKDLLANNTAKQQSSTQQYYDIGVLRMGNGIEHTGDIQWPLVCALLAGWVLCFLCLLKGIKSSGKVIYFTSLFPYVVLLILLIYGCLLPGSLDGIKFYIYPDWSKLRTAKVWVDAAGQIFFSLSVGAGGLMTFASYNKFNNNVYRDALIVSIGNCLTSFFAGFAIFAILGYMAHELNTKVPDIAVEGSTLVFVAYPTALARMPIPQLWSVLFFIMLLTLGLDSLFAGMETNITAFVDTFPKTRKYKPLVTLFLCVTFFLMGLPMTTEAGVYWLNIIAYYATGWSLVIVGMLEAMVFAWIYGARNLREHVKEMCGFSIGPHWWFVWTFISPLLLLGILVFSLIEFKPLAFGPYIFPEWATAIGWLIALTPIGFLLIMAFVTVIQTFCGSQYAELRAYEKFLKLFKPSPEWKANTSTADSAVNGGPKNNSRAKDYSLNDMGSTIPNADSGYPNKTFMSDDL